MRAAAIRLLVLFAPGLALAAPDRPPPPPEKRPVVDEYHGVKVTDPYRWLEDTAEPAVRAWADAEAAHARAALDALPARGKIRARVAEVQSDPSPVWGALRFEDGRLFALKRQPPKQQRMLVLVGSIDDPRRDRIILDPTAIDPDGLTTIDFYQPSPDGKKVAVSLSRKGTEDGDVHVYDVDTGHEIGAPVPRVNSGTAGGSLAWKSDGLGFYYTRHPLPGERPPADLGFFQQVYFHALVDDPKKDGYELGKGFPRIAENQLSASRSGRYIVDLVENGDGEEFEVYLHDVPTRRWTKVAGYADGIKAASVGDDDKLYLRSVVGAPRGRILRLDPRAPDLAKAEVVVPEGPGVITEFVATANQIYVASVVGGPMQLDVYPLDGRQSRRQSVKLPPVSSVLSIVPTERDDVLFATASFLDPGGWFAFDAAAGSARKTALSRKSRIDTSRLQVTRQTARSKDGTQVPYSVIAARGMARNGRNPTLLTGYGGFGISQTPYYSSTLLLFVEQGGVAVVANLRGGGELGEDWHRGGSLTAKQNVFDDFYAVARRLVADRVTGPRKLAILGASNGGLLMGAELTQHPDAFAAVVSEVGIYDMLRVENDPNGTFNVTEYGTVKDKPQFEALYGYSPYQHVKDGVRYPPTLLSVGANDPRVLPYHSYKMLARLRAADPSGRFLLRLDTNSGHGAGRLSDAIELDSDILAFVFDRLGVSFRPRKQLPG